MIRQIDLVFLDDWRLLRLIQKPVWSTPVHFVAPERYQASTRIASTILPWKLRQTVLAVEHDARRSCRAVIWNNRAAAFTSKRMHGQNWMSESSGDGRKNWKAGSIPFSFRRSLGVLAFRPGWAGKLLVADRSVVNPDGIHALAGLVHPGRRRRGSSCCGTGR